MSEEIPAVFRFAPSPNGALHLGHAYSALINFRMAREVGGRFLLRIEDIDTERCRPDYEAQMLFDLEWLGIEWDEEPRRQSDHFDEYQHALDDLESEGLVYPAFMSRKEIRTVLETWGALWKSDPDGVPHYPGNERSWTKEECEKEKIAKPQHALRLNVEAAVAHINEPLSWFENGEGPLGETGKITASPLKWGDVVLGRSDVPSSYHLSVVMDDALQGVTHVVRGNDLFHATSVHRLLQEVLKLPVPSYTHHSLITDDAGRKLSKRDKDTSLTWLREAGCSPEDIFRMVGVED